MKSNLENGIWCQETRLYEVTLEIEKAKKRKYIVAIKICSKFSVIDIKRIIVISFIIS